MRRLLATAALLDALLAPGAATAQTEPVPFCPAGQTPEFTMGFKALYDRLFFEMGEPVECEHLDPASGDVVQRTTTGVAVYRPATNTPSFVSGTRHWALTARGLLFWDGGSADPPPDALLLFGFAESGSAQCGGATVRWDNPAIDFGTPPAAPLLATLEVAGPDGTTMLREQVQANLSERLFPQLCGDLVGDGGTALLYTTYSGGAHCCSTAFVASLEPTPRRLLRYELNNAGGMEARQLDGGGPLELTSGSDAFAYFGDLPYAASPFLPLAFAYDPQQGEYVEATRHFPDLIQADLDRTLRELDAAVQQGQDPIVQQSLGLKAFAEFALLGHPDVGLAEVKARVGPDAAAWLEAHREEALDLLAQTYP
jgi:hypothetical protein